MSKTDALTFRRRDHAAINALWFGVQFQETAMLAIIVPAIVLRLAPATHTNVLAVLSTLSAIAATIVPPFAGAFSDRARRTGGDRRVHTAVALFVDAIALVAMGLVSTVYGIAWTLVVATIALTAMSTIYQVLLPEIVPRASWGLSAGFRGVMTLVGTIGGLLVAAVFPPATALFTTAFVVAIGAVTLLWVPAAPPAEVAPGPARAVVRSRRDLGITAIARGFIVLGLVLLNTFVLFFFSDILHVRNSSLGTGLVAGASLLGAVASSIWAGTLSDRVDRRIVVALSGIPMTLAALGFALAPDERAIFAYAALFGLGYGGVFSVGWALALDAVPEVGDIARDLGIWWTVSNIPGVLAPVLGAAIIAHGTTPADGYRWLFATAGFFFALGSVTVLFVKRT